MPNPLASSWKQILIAAGLRLSRQAAVLTNQSVWSARRIIFRHPTAQRFPPASCADIRKLKHCGSLEISTISLMDLARSVQ